jgi:hypothetical protein
MAPGAGTPPVASQARDREDPDARTWVLLTAARDPS